MGRTDTEGALADMPISKPRFDMTEGEKNPNGRPQRYLMCREKRVEICLTYISTKNF
jgi:hypothetical protein